MSARNTVSFSFNNLGPWSDSLIAGLGGSASSVNMLEPLESALPIIKNNPGKFEVGYLFPVTESQEKKIETTEEINGPFGPTVERASDEFNRWIRENIWGIPGGKPLELSSLNPFSAANQESTLAWVGKNAIVALLGLILIVFGIWILAGKNVIAVAKGIA